MVTLAILHFYTLIVLSCRKAAKATCKRAKILSNEFGICATSSLTATESTNMEVKSLSFQGLSFAYPDSPEKLILENIDLEINTGDFVCLLGQSGCGKSTLLRLAAGLEKPSTGTVYANGAPIKSAGLDRGVVFQDYGLFPWKTAGENITFALHQRFPKENKAWRKEIALGMLRDVGLTPDVFDKLPKELSGGMKQRCAIARAFAIDPPVLLMDEPFGALDAVTRAKLQDMVLRLWRKEEVRKTVLFVTHDVDEALLLATKVVILGQKPSKIIYQCTLPEPKRSREEIYEDKAIIDLRNTLIKQINLDVAQHIS